jgi:uroporphyrinogen-III synthase
LVTRPREEAQVLADALAARGVDALIEPMMEIHFCDAVPDLRGVQAVLCTSANGVRALARTTRERAVPVLAVGDATAARARAEGFPDVASAGGTVADLVKLAGERLRPRAGRLLHVAGSAVAGDLAGDLQVGGFDAERCVLYEPRPVAALSADAIQAFEAAAIDFVLLFSPRTAAIFAGLVETAGLGANCASAIALSISAAADKAIGELPWHERLVADHPDLPAMLDLLDRRLAAPRPV